MADYLRVAGIRLVSALEAEQRLRVAGIRLVNANMLDPRLRVAGIRLVTAAAWPLSDPTPEIDTAPTTLKGETDVMIRVALDPGIDIDYGIDRIETDLSFRIGESQPRIEDFDRVYNVEAKAISASATDTYDLRGSLVDRYENDIQIAGLRWIVLHNTGLTSLSIGPHSVAGITGVWTGTTPRSVVAPSGVFLWSAPTQLDISGGADTISVINLSGSTAGQYEIMICGTRP